MKKTRTEINCILGEAIKQSAQRDFVNAIGNKISEPRTISNQFNDFFVNVGPKLASEILNPNNIYFDYLQEAKSSKMYMKPVIENHILKIVEKLNAKKRWS